MASVEDAAAEALLESGPVDAPYEEDERPQDKSLTEGSQSMSDQDQTATSDSDQNGTNCIATQLNSENELEKFLLAHHGDLEAHSTAYRKLMVYKKIDLVRKDLVRKFDEYQLHNQNAGDPQTDITSFYEDLLKQFEADGQLQGKFRVPPNRNPMSIVAGCFNTRGASHKALLKVHKELLKNDTCEYYSKYCEEKGRELLQDSLLVEFRKYRSNHAELTTNQVKGFLEKNLTDLKLLSDNFV